VVSSSLENARLIAAAPNLKSQTALSVAYGTGLRASEVIALKIGDIDSERMTLHLCESKRPWLCSCRVARPIASFHNINRTVSQLSSTALRRPLPRERFSPLADKRLMPMATVDPFPTVGRAESGRLTDAMSRRLTTTARISLPRLRLPAVD